MNRLSVAVRGGALLAVYFDGGSDVAQDAVIIGGELAGVAGGGFDLLGAEGDEHAASACAIHKPRRKPTGIHYVFYD